MSLQVWLPLNGNLNNQGLGNITITSGNPTYKNGKVTSKSLNLNQRIYFTCPQLANLQTFSVCFWGMTENSSTLTTNWQDLIGFTDVSSSGTNGTFRWETCYGYTSADHISIHWHDNTTNALVNGSARHNCSRNEWCHCCVVFDAEKSKIYTYTNGILTAAHNHTGGHFNSEGKFYLGETNNIEGRIQDVRFYDHALSSKEVKEISKGLVLHYPLKDKYIEDTTNLVTSFDTSFESYPDGTFDKFILQAGGTTKVVSNIDGHNKCLCYTPASNGRCYFTLSTKANKTYTISMDYLCSTSNSISLRLERNGGDYSWSGSIISYTIPNKWQKLAITVTNTSDTTFYIFNYAKANTALYIDNIQIEEKDHATPFTLSSRSETTVYDCSGYSNNGTKSGIIICDSNTPRYMTSYKFGSTSAKIKLPTITYSNFGNSYTFSWWQKNTSSGNMPWGFSDGNRLNLYHTTNLCWNTGDSGNNPFKDSVGNAISKSKLCDSTWHHCAIVGNGSSTILYIDGINAGTATIYKPLTGTQIYISGWDSGTSYTFNGSNLVDFRIYATAFSADDIKELYNTSFIVDNTGKAYAYEYIEAN